ncbi:FAD:protein FMN transferase [Dyadobacter sp. NIV53]|uniref:FAD:protein FMN transferase n=1 Tax=Dyadobacter sp. NIV53 TaxID=2861765 RepID=UPI001C87C60B|nr:FAD:protein FMN transferase [Dyadobacter sp. NIV53]
MDESVDDNSNSLFVFDAIGTHWEIETYEPLTDGIKKKVLDRIESFDKTYSRFRTDSLVTEIASASNGGNFNFPVDCIPIFELYDKLHNLTGGAVDPLVGRRLEVLGYDRNYSLTPANDILLHKNHEQKACWGKDVFRDRQSLITNRPVVIDIGAAGKGYLVDLVSEILLKEEVTEFIIDAGGDIRHSGIWKFPIGMQHPLQLEHVIGVIDLQDSAICASASNKRAWGEGLHHILDARVGLPVQDVIATWVIAKNALIADGLATALFFISADKLKGHFQFSSVRMFSNNTIEKSKNFKGELFLD